MIKQFNGISDEYNGGRFDPVPVGSYVGKIWAATLEKNEKDNSDVLAIALEITEGEYSNYYHKRHESEKRNDPAAKFKGIMRLTIPVGDGSERDGWNINKFNRLIGAVTASNAGFKWNWNEQCLIGKAVGLVYRDREWEFNGKSGMTTEIGMLCSVDDARAGKIKLKPRMLANKPAPALAGFVATSEEVPF